MAASDRFNGFVRYHLDDRLFNEIWNLNVFNERDLHAAAYGYVRDYFKEKERDSVFVRCEPQIAKTKPDIVVFQGGQPIYAIEFKVFWRSDYVNKDLVYEDIKKLSLLVTKFDTMRWGFMLVVYDSDEPFTISDQTLRHRGYEKISVTTLNARRTEGTRRRRTGYDDWRRQIDRIRKLHELHA
jgi:hypothetical protein